jgi:anti-sigma B factor antagonist
MSQNQAVQGCRVEVLQDGSAHVVTVQGSLADEGNTRAKEVFLQLLGQHPTRIVVDLVAMDYISSSGIGLLVSVLRRCRQRGISMAVCGLKPEILELFKLTRLSQVFEVFENREKALLAH